MQERRTQPSLPDGYRQTERKGPFSHNSFWAPPLLHRACFRWNAAVAQRLMGYVVPAASPVGGVRLGLGAVWGCPALDPANLSPRDRGGDREVASPPAGELVSSVVPCAEEAGWGRGSRAAGRGPRGAAQCAREVSSGLRSVRSVYLSCRGGVPKRLAAETWARRLCTPRWALVEMELGGWGHPWTPRLPGPI
jgi:hypothetical protein